MKAYGKRSGFSMVEVLVASAILIVIVMMLAMLFQQTSLSWRTGVRRADAYMQIRSGIGAIQRDAANAVDQRTIPQALRSKIRGSQQFTSSQLSFFTLTGSYVGTRSDVPSRVLTFITYNKTGERKETLLMGDNRAAEGVSRNVLDFINKASSANKPKTTITAFDPVPGRDPNGLPLFVTIKASVSTSGQALDIGAGSAGPDKTWNTKDDIKTWVEEN